MIKNSRINNAKKYIFIMGVSRTGSKFYMQFLNSNPSVNIVPEMVLQHPFKKNFIDLVGRKISKKNISGDVLVDFILGLGLKDTYSSVVNKLDRRILAEYINNNGNHPLNLFRFILELSSSGRPIVGAKFPAHYTYTNTLLCEFPDAKVLYLTRNPIDIYFSDFYNKQKRLKGTRYFYLARFLLRPFVFLYTCFEWVNSISVYEKLRDIFGDKKIKLFYYEDIVNSREKLACEIAGFVDLPLCEFRLDDIRVVDSSFSAGEKIKPLKLSRFEAIGFKFILGKKMRHYGYDVF